MRRDPAASSDTGAPAAEEGVPAVPSSTTTLVEHDLVDPFPTAAPIELAPAGSYPVVDLGKTDLESLAPGTYRYRLGYQLGRPDECLEEFVILEPFKEDTAPTPLSTEERNNFDPDAADRYLDDSRPAMDRRIELQRPICEGFWSKTPGAVDSPAVEPGEPGPPTPTTTTPDR